MIDKQIKKVDKWFIFPDSLNPPQFRGYITRDDISSMRGGFPVAQNIQFTDGLTPTVRPGSALVGTEKEGAYPIKRAWRFERRDGVEIEMRAYNTVVDFRVEGEMDEYQDLLGGFTAGLEFCYAVISKSSIVPSYVYFCNGVEDWYKWTGAFAKYVSDDGANTITVDTELTKPAFLISGNVFVSPSDFASVSDGSFRVTINGTARNIDGIDFTGVTSMDEVASVIQTALRAVTLELETVTYDSGSNVLKLETVDGPSSSITTATTSTGTVGTDISGVGAGLYTRWSADEDAGVFDREAVLFDTSGVVTIGGVDINYTGTSGYTFTGCSVLPSSPIAGDIIIQKPKRARLIDFRGGVGMAHNGRIHARLENKKSVSNYSKLDNPDDWTTGADDGDGGAKEIEQGGPITAYGRDEENLYIFKKRQIKILKFKQTGDRVDVPVYSSLKPADDKSTTSGAIGQKSTFHSPNGVIFVTEDKELIHLTRKESIDYPQLITISDLISPTFKAGIHDEAAGIVYKSKVYYAFKQDSDSSFNDTVIVYDLIRQIWYAPYVGWNVNDWTIIDNKLRWHSSINSNTYELQSDFMDDDSAYTTILRTHSEDFGEPFFQKTSDGVAVEAYLSDNFKGMVTILYDDDGFTDRLEIEIDLENSADDRNHVLKDTEYNLFGSSPFGTQRFGSNENMEGMKRYIFIIPIKANIQFFNISVQISTDKQNCNYELIRYAYHILTMIQVHQQKFIKNIS